MNRRVRSLVGKEFQELRRTPRLLGLILVAPALQLGLLGYAATTDVRDVPVVVADGDRSSASRDLVGRFRASRHFEIVAELDAPGEADAYLSAGTAWLAVVIPAGLERALGRGGDAPAAAVQILADGTDATSSGVALAYATGIVTDYNQSILASPGAIDARVRVWFNPELESRFFMVPGVLALLLLVVTANLSSMAIVREREVGTLEQLHVTPLGRWELIGGKMLPYALIGLIDVAIVVAVAVWWFEVPFRGSVWMLLGGSGAYLLCTLGLGLFVSTVSATQQQAMMTATFFFLVPMVYLSGFIFPIENMPPVIQAVTTLIPLRYFLVIVRGVFLKGIGLDVLWPQVAALLGWGAAMVALAVLRTRKQG